MHHARKVVVTIWNPIITTKSGERVGELRPIFFQKHEEFGKLEVFGPSGSSPERERFGDASQLVRAIENARGVNRFPRVTASLPRQAPTDGKSGEVVIVTGDVVVRYAAERSVDDEEAPGRLARLYLTGAIAAGEGPTVGERINVTPVGEAAQKIRAVEADLVKKPTCRAIVVLPAENAREPEVAEALTRLRGRGVRVIEAEALKDVLHDWVPLDAWDEARFAEEFAGWQRRRGRLVFDWWDILRKVAITAVATAVLLLAWNYWPGLPLFRWPSPLACAAVGLGCPPVSIPLPADFRLDRDCQPAETRGEPPICRDYRDCDRMAGDPLDPVRIGWNGGATLDELSANAATAEAMCGRVLGDLGPPLRSPRITYIQFRIAHVLGRDDETRYLTAAQEAGYKMALVRLALDDLARGQREAARKGLQQLVNDPQELHPPPEALLALAKLYACGPSDSANPAKAHDYAQRATLALADFPPSPKVKTAWTAANRWATQLCTTPTTAPSPTENHH